MACEDINHDALWGILHLPTRKLLRQWPCGYGHTQLDVVDDPARQRKTMATPRLFLSEDTAKRALTQWLADVHRNHYDDGLEVTSPVVPRIKEDMKVVQVFMYMDQINEPDY